VRVGTETNRRKRTNRKDGKDGKREVTMTRRGANERKRCGSAELEGLEGGTLAEY